MRQRETRNPAHSPRCPLLFGGMRGRIDWNLWLDSAGTPGPLLPGIAGRTQWNRHLGLDAERNWIMATEVNTFFWPGPDLALNEAGAYQYGELPAVVFNALKAKILAAGDVSSVERTD